jgi:YbgC/YbaW family acyl-CoA thioester hydrolase
LTTASAPQGPARFVHEDIVRFDHIDAAGIVYFARMLDYCHEAYEGFLAQIGFPLPQILATAPWKTPVVHTDADYQRPLRHGERFCVEVRIESIGHRSYAVAYRIALAESRETQVATCRIVHASIDNETFRPIPIPADFRAALSGEDR